MSRPTIIGIAGKARSGKDTVANFVVAHLGGYVYSFADPIRRMIAQLGVDMSDPYWQEHKEDIIPALGVSPRHMMQTLGTEWGRELINKDLWVAMARQRLLHSGAGMVIPDVRFDSEAEWIRRAGGIVIHVRRCNVAAVKEHSSESGVTILPEDFVLPNNGSLEDLQFAVRSLLHGRQT